MSEALDLLKSSFAALKPYSDEAMDHFIRHLFDQHPEVRFYFDETMLPRQRNALRDFLAYVIEHADQPERLTPYLEELGRRHAPFGAPALHFQYATESFLSTLGYYFDETWTPELAGAWRDILRRVSETVLEAQKSQTVPAEESLSAQIHSVLKELIRDSLEDLCADQEIARLAKQKAKLILQQAVERELAELKHSAAGGRTA